MIGIEQIILSSVGASFFTIIINSFIKRYEKNQNLKKLIKIFIKFIDDIIVKYLTINIQEYEKILKEIENKNDLFSSRKVTESPMLNRGIFDFFEKSDLIKIFSYCKENSLVDVYHYFYEIDFLQQSSPQNLLNIFKSEIESHYELHKKNNETFEQHNNCCNNYEDRRNLLRDRINLYNEHTKELIDNFYKIKLELSSIEELNDDEY